MKALPTALVPPEWLRFLAAWGLGLAELPQAMPGAPAALAPTPSPRIRRRLVRGRG